MFTRPHCAQVGDGFRGFPGRPNEPELRTALPVGRFKFVAIGLLIWTAMVLASNGLPAAAAVFVIIASMTLLVTALGLPGGSIGDFRTPAAKAAGA